MHSLYKALTAVLGSWGQMQREKEEEYNKHMLLPKLRNSITSDVEAAFATFF